MNLKKTWVVLLCVKVNQYLIMNLYWFIKYRKYLNVCSNEQIDIEMALSDGNLKYVTDFDSDKDWIHFEKNFRYGSFHFRICGQVFCIKNDFGELGMSTVQPGQVLASTCYDIEIENAEFSKLQKRLSLLGSSNSIYTDGVRTYTYVKELDKENPLVVNAGFNSKNRKVCRLKKDLELYVKDLDEVDIDNYACDKVIVHAKDEKAEIVMYTGEKPLFNELELDDNVTVNIAIHTIITNKNIKNIKRLHNVMLGDTRIDASKLISISGYITVDDPMAEYVMDFKDSYVMIGPSFYISGTDRLKFISRNEEMTHQLRLRTGAQVINEY